MGSISDYFDLIETARLRLHCGRPDDATVLIGDDDAGGLPIDLIRRAPVAKPDSRFHVTRRLHR